MSCLITSGRTLGCRNNTAGIKEFYIGNFEEIGSITPTDPDSSQLITDISMSFGTTFYKFVPNKYSSTAESKGVGSDENSSVEYTHTVTSVFSRNSSTTLEQVKLAAGGNTVIITKDFNDDYFLYGRDNGMSLNDFTMTSGKSGTELNGSTLVFTGRSKYPAFQVTGSIISGLIA